MTSERRKVKMLVGDGSPIATIKIDRNSKCRCGSGKKAKHCCGTETRFFSTKPKQPETHKQQPES